MQQMLMNIVSSLLNLRLDGQAASLGYYQVVSDIFLTLLKQGILLNRRGLVFKVVLYRSVN